MARLGKTEISGVPIIKELIRNQANKHDAVFIKFLQECRKVACATEATKILEGDY